MEVSALSALKLSFWVGLWSTLLALIPAIFVAWLLTYKDFKGKALLNILLFFPMVSPPVVTGFIMLMLTGRNSFLAKTFGVQIPFTILGAILASIVVGFPLLVMFIRAAFAGLDPQLAQYALTAGHRPLATFLKVTLPLSLPGILAGATVSFARSLGEFGATVVLAGNMEGETRTIPLAIYTLMDAPGRSAEVNFLLYTSIALSFAALLTFEVCNRFYWKRIEWKR